jgi:hypothetical protein
MKKDKRFEVVQKEGSGFSGFTKILRDKQTGIHYLYYGIGYGAGLTPLLDVEGRPITDRRMY